MTKIYHLSNCGTCQKIIKELQTVFPDTAFDMQDIKQQAPTEAEIDQWATAAGSYEAIFSKKAMLYKEYGLAQQQLTESDYRKYILEHYTFLKRPFIVTQKGISVGNKGVVEQVKAIL